ncbi:hypothetical protein JQK15_21215 [Sphingobium sp. BHU LFT2]|nr:hypothetical protein [Sphingobium sp. BHU LFT2]
MLILEEDYRIIFYNRQQDRPGSISLIGRNWLDQIPKNDRAAASAALAGAKIGDRANLIVGLSSSANTRRWFDIAINRTTDASGRLIVVARDIPHQKRSEEQALWMARAEWRCPPIHQMDKFGCAPATDQQMSFNVAMGIFHVPSLPAP